MTLPGRSIALGSCKYMRVMTLHRHLPTKTCTYLAVRSKPLARGPSWRLPGIAPGDEDRYLQPASAVHAARHCFVIASGMMTDEPAPSSAHAGRLRLRYCPQSGPPAVRRIGRHGRRLFDSVAATSGGHAGLKHPTQAGSTVSYAQVSLSNAQERPSVPLSSVSPCPWAAWPVATGNGN